MKEKHSGVDTWAHVQSEDGINWRSFVRGIRRVGGNGAQGGDWGKPEGAAETTTNNKNNRSNKYKRQQPIKTARTTPTTGATETTNNKQQQEQ